MRRIAVLFFPIVAAALPLVLIACGPTSSSTPTAPSEAPASAEAIPSTQASAHIGDRVTVCGPVVDTRYATGSNGKPTFLNFDRAYPNHTFVVVIWGNDRGKFPANPETYYEGKEVCATGLIENYRGKPEIIASNANQLQVGR